MEKEKKSKLQQHFWYRITLLTDQHVSVCSLSVIFAHEIVQLKFKAILMLHKQPFEQQQLEDNILSSSYHNLVLLQLLDLYHMFIIQYYIIRFTIHALFLLSFFIYVWYFWRTCWCELWLLFSDESGLLVHCISGWDRTPLFVSLLRLSLWAVSSIHCVQSLVIIQITIKVMSRLCSYRAGRRRVLVL